MHRALFKLLVVLGLGLGLTFTSTPIAGASAPAADRAALVAAAPTAPDCSAKEAALAKARANYGSQVSTAKKVRNLVAKAQRAEKRATTRKAKKARHAAVVKVSKQFKAEMVKVRAGLAVVRIHQERVADCKNVVPTGPTASPLQTLCDAGIPQQICDILGELVPGGSTASPLYLLCSSAPQAKPLCDLISAGTAPNATDLLNVVNTVLGALGLGGLLDDLLGGLGLGTVLDPNDLLDLLDLLGGLLP